MSTKLPVAAVAKLGEFETAASEAQALVMSTRASQLSLDERIAAAFADDATSASVADLVKEAEAASVAAGAAARCVWGEAPSPCPALVREILQRDAHTPVLEQGRAGTAGRSDCRSHSLPADPGRVAPPLCSDLICGRHGTSVPHGEFVMLVLSSGQRS